MPPAWLETVPCPKCGRDMPCVEHEAQEIADQVKRTYRCECGHSVTLPFSVFDDVRAEQMRARLEED